MSGAELPRRGMSFGIALVMVFLALGAHSYAVEQIDLARARHEMIERHLRGRDITDPLVLRAMAKVPREAFVGPDLQATAYADRPLPIGEGQTISQPYIVALMTQLLGLTGAEKVLEVGTGSGYQAAVLAEIVSQVYTIEILPALAAGAAARLRALGYDHVQVRAGDGYQGWPDAAPFDAIVVTAGASHIPGPLIEQLAEGGRLVIPVGPTGMQDLIAGQKLKGRLVTRVVAPVRFVPLVEPRR